jgi:hypothetical protein
MTLIAITKNIVPINDDVANVDADAKLNRLSVATPSLRSVMPRCTSTAQRTASNTLEFQQQTITGRLDDAAVMFGDLGVDKLPPMGFSATKVPLSSTPMRRVTGHIE